MNNNLVAYERALPVGSLEAYMHWVNTIPMLSADEEAELAKRLQENNDVEAARKLVLAHLRYVVKVARGFSGYGLALGDLIQEGNIGLMKAVKRFDPSMGVRLVTFALYWIKSEIHDFIIKNWRVVKVATTKAQRKLFFNLRRAVKHLGFSSEEEVNQVAADLKVSPQEVREMEKRLSAMDIAFDKHDDDVAAPADYLASDHSNPEQLLEYHDDVTMRTAKLQQAMQALDKRSTDIVKQRWLADKKATLDELAQKYHVSIERIRQLEQAAMRKLQQHVAG